MSWNIEGLRRNIFNLKELIDEYEPDFVFLSESQLYSCDVNLSMRYLENTYGFYLNSSDKFDHDLPLTHPKAWGGTMAIWKISLDPYLSIQKSRDQSKLQVSETFNDFTEDYDNILNLAKHSPPIKPITEGESLNLLLKMKTNVSDLYSITPSHYINAGPVGYRHFHLLLSSLINDLATTTIFEVNAAYAVVLFKGHSKDKTSSRS